jgi:hypothetical protein
MTDPQPQQNGRVTTRDLLAAVEGSEERVTHRINRLEASVSRRLDDHQTRLTVLETERAIDHARARSVMATVAGIKGFILVAVAIISVAIGGIGVAVAMDANADQHTTERAVANDGSG